MQENMSILFKKDSPLTIEDESIPSNASVNSLNRSRSIRDSTRDQRLSKQTTSKRPALSSPNLARLSMRNKSSSPATSHLKAVDYQNSVSLPLSSGIGISKLKNKNTTNLNAPSDKNKRNTKNVNNIVNEKKKNVVVAVASEDLVVDGGAVNSLDASSSYAAVVVAGNDVVGVACPSAVQDSYLPNIVIHETVDDDILNTSSCVADVVNGDVTDVGVAGASAVQDSANAVQDIYLPNAANPEIVADDTVIGEFPNMISSVNGGNLKNNQSNNTAQIEIIKQTSNNNTKNVIIGTNSSCGNLRVAYKFKWFHIGSFRYTTTPDEVIAFVSTSLGIDSSLFVCHKLSKNADNDRMHGFVNFKIGVPVDVASLVFAENFWPIGVKIRPFVYMAKNSLEKNVGITT